MATLYAIPKHQPAGRVARRDDNCIRTFTGQKFWPLDPRAEEIHIEDIAHHLANVCRFTGATRCHYSVADHAIRVSRVAELLVLQTGRTPEHFTLAREVALWGLHHDDSEAYLSDLAAPVKHAPGLGDIYRAVEKELMREVIARFDLMPHEPSVVKHADNILLASEGRDLVDSFIVPKGAITLDEVIFPLTPDEAEYEFLRRHHALIMARNAEDAVKQI